MKAKAIHVQTENPDTGVISSIKPYPWVSVTWDNTKMVIHAYDGSGYSAEPLEDCLVEIVDGKEVFCTTAEQLLHIIRFFIQYNSDKEAIIRFPNKFQHVIRDAIKQPRKD